MDGDGDGKDRLGVGAALAGAQRAPQCRSRRPVPDVRPWEPAGTGRGCAGSPRLYLRGSGGAPGSQSGAAAGVELRRWSRPGAGTESFPEAPSPQWSRAPRVPKMTPAPSLGMGLAAGTSGSVGEPPVRYDTSGSHPSPGTARSRLSPSVRFTQGK